MKLNLVTKDPQQVYAVLRKMYPQACIRISPINHQICDFEVVEEEPAVYPLEGLLELTYHTGLTIDDIRIY